LYIYVQVSRYAGWSGVGWGGLGRGGVGRIVVWWGGEWLHHLLTASDKEL